MKKLIRKKTARAVARAVFSAAHVAAEALEGGAVLCRKAQVSAQKKFESYDLQVIALETALKQCAASKEIEAARVNLDAAQANLRAAEVGAQEAVDNANSVIHGEACQEGMPPKFGAMPVG